MDIRMTRTNLHNHNNPREDEWCHDEALCLMAQRYIKVCQARRSLEIEIKKGLEPAEFKSMKHIINAKRLAEGYEEAIVGTLNQAGWRNIFKLPSPKDIAMEGKERPP